MQLRYAQKLHIFKVAGDMIAEYPVIRVVRNCFYEEESQWKLAEL
jgi:hypothetical protein